jgi:Fe-S-cluster containining protein
MPSSDSVDKIVKRYFRCLTRVPFDFAGERIEPQPLIVSPLLLRDYTCPINCGACCFRFSLDYLPSEDRPEGAVARKIDFDGRKVKVYSIMQEEGDHFCGKLNRENGRCGIYQQRPFSCDFELIRTLESETQAVLTQKLYGRGWNMLRVDGEKGNLCEMTPVTEHSKSEVIRKLRRLSEWAGHFGIETWAETIVDLIQRGRLTRTSDHPSGRIILPFQHRTFGERK